MKTTSLLLGTAAVLAMIGTASAATHPAMSGKMTGNHRFAHPPVNRGSTVLYDQNDNSEGYADVSQNFESSLDAYDAQGADDFTVPAGEVWSISEVDVTGLYFQGSYGPADSENVFFYKSKKGEPGKQKGKTVTVAGTDDGVGDFVITLPKSAKLKGGKKGTTYWVSVQANQNYNPNGEWGWATRTVQAGKDAQWRNPGGGFAVGCTDWDDEATCLGGVAGPDHMFTLRGTSK